VHRIKDKSVCDNGGGLTCPLFSFLFFLFFIQVLNFDLFYYTGVLVARKNWINGAVAPT
jgi:hypothetical protein